MVTENLKKYLKLAADSKIPKTVLVALLSNGCVLKPEVLKDLGNAIQKIRENDRQVFEKECLISITQNPYLTDEYKENLKNNSEFRKQIQSVQEFS